MLRIPDVAVDHEGHGKSEGPVPLARQHQDDLTEPVEGRHVAPCLKKLPLSCHDVASYIGDIGSDRRQSGAFAKFGRQQLQSNSLALSRVPDAYVAQ